MYQTPEGIWVRDKGEEGVREQQREYRYLEDMYKEQTVGDVWDIGAHVGWFGWYLRKTCDPNSLLCVECAPKQLELLRINSTEDTKILAGAIVPEDYSEPAMNLYLGKTYTSCDSTFCEVKGRKKTRVRAIKPEAILKACPNPQIIKMDCEGAEYHFIPQKHIPDSVELFLAELHHNRKGQEELLEKFVFEMQEIGFSETKPIKLNNYTKTVHVTMTRSI